MNEKLRSPYHRAGWPGTLPLLAVSGRAFLWLKLVNIAFGFLLGLIGLYLLP